MNHNNDQRRLWESLKQRGYYIALVLCLCATGIGGYVYYRSNKTPAPTVREQTLTIPQVTRPAAAVPGATESTLPVLGTLPAETEPAVQTPAPRRTAWPVDGETAAAYAMDHLSYNETTRDWRTHNGIDLAAEAGTPVCAASDGTVYTVYTDDLLGTTVVLRHPGGYTTTYASLSDEVFVEAGQQVACGQELGTVGTSALTETGLAPHVHFAAALDSAPIDPTEFLEAE